MRTPDVNILVYAVNADTRPGGQLAHPPHARILNPTNRHAALLARLLLGAGRGGNLVSDRRPPT